MSKPNCQNADRQPALTRTSIGFQQQFYRCLSQADMERPACWQLFCPAVCNQLLSEAVDEGFISSTGDTEEIE